MRTIAEKRGTTPAAVAVAWLLRLPVPVQVIVGTGSPAHLTDACRAVEIELSRQEWYNLFRAAGYATP